MQQAVVICAMAVGGMTRGWVVRRGTRIVVDLDRASQDKAWPWFRVLNGGCNL